MYGRDKHHKSGRGEGGGGIARRRTQLRGQTLQPDSLDLAQRNLIFCPIVELSGARRLMSGHLLGVLKPSVSSPGCLFFLSR